LNYQDQIAAALKGQDADYIEVRIDDSEASHIQYRGKDLEDISKSKALGGSARALVKGGWGFVSFNNLDNLRKRVELAVQQAGLVGREESNIYLTSPIVDFVDEKVEKDASSVPLAEKKRILDEYIEVIWSVPKIETSSIGYRDLSRRSIFANSEGSYIEQKWGDLALRISAIAREGSDVQQSGVSLGSRGNIAQVEGIHDQVKEVAERAVELLSAPQLKGGEYTVILDPVLAGVFTHEAFGHLSEADFVYENDRMREIMILGKRFGDKHLNIVDDATLNGLRGSYKYDDEGIPAARSYLINEGVLVGRLHSRETAARMAEAPTGNARAINYRHAPIVRMSNTFIEPQGVSFKEMIGNIKEGVYARNWYGGTTSMEMFTFSAGEAYMISQGKLAELLRPVVLTGNIFTTLNNIDAIGDDLDMNQGGGCGKGGQSPLPVSNGSPHIRIQHCLIGGK